MKCIYLLFVLIIFISVRCSDKATVYVPEIDSEWWNISDNPDLGTYTSQGQQPVDFGIWEASDGTYQLWSCIRNTNAGGKTRLFYKWEGKSLTGSDWTPKGIAMESDTTLGETHSGLQAPFVLKDNGKYYMFYGDWVNICMAESNDGKSFDRILGSDNKPALFTSSQYGRARDPMVLKIKGTYYCYYMANEITDDGSDHPKSAIFCRTSKDLRTWSDEIVVSRGGSAMKLTDWYGGDTECPFVVMYNGKYILFRNQVYGQKSMNTQYCSDNPLDFGIDNDNYLAGHLPYAAPEIIKAGDQYYIFALKPGLDGIMAAKIKFVKRSINDN